MPVISLNFFFPKIIRFCYLVIYGLAVSFMAINSGNIGSSIYLGCLCLALFLSLLIPVDIFLNCLFFTIPFTAVLKLPIEIFSFVTLLQLILILRAVLSNVNIRLLSIILIIVLAVLTQIIPVLLYEQTFANILLLALNILTFYCTFKLAKYSKIHIMAAYTSFAVGVLIAGLIAINYDILISEIQDYRFCGLWTDPNFWGMFCLIGIFISLLSGFKTPWKFIFLIPLIIALALQGFTTLSRTFLFVNTLMIPIILYRYMKRNIWISFIIIIFLFVGVYYAWPYVETVFDKRALDENDFSNGRFESTLVYFSFLENNPLVALFGIGYNNVLNMQLLGYSGHLASHNTYADLFIEFGFLSDLLIVFFILKRWKYIKGVFRNLRTIPGLVILVLLFYMGTLSMFKYALVYLFIGLFCGYSSEINLEKKK